MMLNYTYRRGCSFTGKRGERITIQSWQPSNARSFTNVWRFLWKDDTQFAATTVPGRWLYTHIRPRMLRRSISKKSVFRMSMNSLWCRLAHLLVIDAFADASLKNSWKCGGPLPKTHRCITPNIAISRLHASGAKLKINNVVFAVMPSSDRKRSWKLSNRCKVVLHAWYIAAMRHSNNKTTI